ncbi:LAG1-domain-containing protein [Jaminaea rosea]|uniref:LAG1-domain-containing protein n=1 Tax=Jaminaea rosea TaxID=1569628 RepID=A0A316US55_9BASI|nr:LAG1-domain-containing protein [Jaminaea rosea]PWN27608.1 LAG1-domain-containing protein [Jaminaea rosea]
MAKGSRSKGQAAKAQHQNQQQHGPRSSSSSSSSPSSWEHRKRGPRRRKASEVSLDRQLEWPLYTLAALLVCHALSGTGSLSLAHLSAHLPYSIQKLLPTWARTLPNLAPFASDVPNASHDLKSFFFGSGGGSAAWLEGQAGPFRSEAAGFGHPLTALHTFTKACLGLSYAVRPASSSSSAAAQELPLGHPAPEPWAWLVGQPDTLYSKGAKDVLYVLTWILVWTALRAAVIRYMLVPLGTRWVTRPRPQPGKAHPSLRDRKLWHKSVTRFAEQGWAVVFYIASWSLGLHIAHQSSYWLNPSGFWQGHPHLELEGIVKFYYLTQCAYWFHMLIVINVEARRKDHWQMFSHHIITIALLVGSYRAHFTRVGNAVLCLMDPSDILLSLAKCLRYVGMQTLCDVAFGVFMLSWIVTRHVLYCVLLWSSIKTIPRHLFALATAGADPAMVRIDWSRGLPGLVEQFYDEALPANAALVALLVALQVILLLWFAMIVRVAYKVITGSGASDTRSSGEELSDEDEREVSRQEEKEAAARRRVGGGEKGSSKPVAANSSPQQSTPTATAAAAAAASATPRAAAVQPFARSETNGTAGGGGAGGGGKKRSGKKRK